MQDRQPEFELLMQRVQGGSQEAARELFDLYGPHILRVVRRKLHQNLRAKYDSLDFVQEVWTSFFTNCSDRRFDRPEALVAFLGQMACNKVVDAFRHRVQTTKHNISLEHSFDSASVYEGTDLVSPRPSPSQVALANEEWDRLLAGQPPRYRPILVLLRMGHTHEDIAKKLGLNEKTVRRLIRRLSPEMPQ